SEDVPRVGQIPERVAYVPAVSIEEAGIAVAEPAVGLYARINVLGDLVKRHVWSPESRVRAWRSPARRTPASQRGRTLKRGVSIAHLRPKIFSFSRASRTSSAIQSRLRGRAERK